MTSREALDLLDRALAEDVGPGDLTTEALIAPDRTASARLVAREELVLAGLPLALSAFRGFDPGVEVRGAAAEGALLAPGEDVARLRGKARALLTAERSALNLLQRLSGIATAARRAVEAVRGTRTRVLDTRKTAPGLRRLEKYAAAVGGATNHRMGLHDAVLIKDNHLALLAGERMPVAAAVARSRAGVPPGTTVEVELDSLDRLEEAFVAGPDAILLDNFSPQACAEAVRRRDAHAARGGRRIFLEASGGIRPDTVRLWAEAGVDGVSLGWITHSARAADIALDFEPC
ncbi:MAG: carboxylating nicotinate-nucleotide diphosphorylase [Planctomycetes bacterium]|nr:carboxylating nicotinate-nucleotide diphosphorylase [Planctomycetota bacterium]